jgi:hypothetical protein
MVPSAVAVPKMRIAIFAVRPKSRSKPALCAFAAPPGKSGLVYVRNHPARPENDESGSCMLATQP